MILTISCSHIVLTNIRILVVSILIQSVYIFLICSLCTISFVSEEGIGISDIIGHLDTFSGENCRCISGVDGSDDRHIFRDQDADTQYTYSQYKNHYEHLDQGESFFEIPAYARMTRGIPVCTGMTIVIYLQFSREHRWVLRVKQVVLFGHTSSMMFGDVTVHHKLSGCLMIVRFPDMVWFLSGYVMRVHEIFWVILVAHPE